MAKLSGPLHFEGKLDDFSGYKIKGFEATVPGLGWKPSRKDKALLRP